MLKEKKMGNKSWFPFCWVKMISLNTAVSGVRGMAASIA
jgi:hypothetical protein